MTEWFKKWFSSNEYLSVYSHRNEDDAKNIINLILGKIPEKDNLSILDAACGAGRHSILLAGLGHNVTAFDLSKTLLKIGKVNASELRKPVNFVCSDIRNVAFNTSFDLVLNMFTSFGYFDTDEENFMFYKDIKNCLNKKGIIVLDYLNEYYLRRNLVPVSVKTISGRQIEESRSIRNNKVVKDIVIRHNGAIHKFCESVKLYTYESLVKNFEVLGYHVETAIGDYKGRVFDKETSKRVILFLTI